MTIQEESFVLMETYEIEESFLKGTYTSLLLIHKGDSVIVTDFQGISLNFPLGSLALSPMSKI